MLKLVTYQILTYQVQKMQRLTMFEDFAKITQYWLLKPWNFRFSTGFLICSEIWVRGQCSVKPHMQRLQLILRRLPLSIWPVNCGCQLLLASDCNYYSWELPGCEMKILSHFRRPPQVQEVDAWHTAVCRMHANCIIIVWRLQQPAYDGNGDESKLWYTLKQTTELLEHWLQNGVVIKLRWSVLAVTA